MQDVIKAEGRNLYGTTFYVACGRNNLGHVGMVIENMPIVEIMLPQKSHPQIPAKATDEIATFNRPHVDGKANSYHYYAKPTCYGIYRTLRTFRTISSAD